MKHAHDDSYRDLVLEIQYEVGSIGRQDERKQQKLLAACLDKMKGRLAVELLMKDAYHFEQLFMEFWKLVQMHRGSEVYLYSAVYFADYLELLGRFQEGFVFCFEQDADARVIVEEGHPCRILLQERLGISYYHLGDYEMAFELAEDAWIDCRHMKTRDIWMYTHLLKYCALITCALGREKEAKKYAKELLRCVRKQYGDDSVYTVDAYDVMAACLCEEAHESRADKKLYAEYVSFCNIFEEGHPFRLHMANQISAHKLFLEKNQKYPNVNQEYIGYLLENLAVARSTYGDAHEETFLAFINVGHANLLAGETEKALFYLQKCYEGVEKALGEAHPFTVRLMRELWECSAAMGDEEEAQRYRKKAEEREAQTENERLEELIEASTEHLQEMWELRKIMEKEQKEKEKQELERERAQEEAEIRKQREKADQQYHNKLKDEA